jgi:signal transduction histidine kinase
MYEALSRLAPSADRWLDGILAATVVIIGAAELAFSASQGTALTLGVAAVGIFAAIAVAIRRWRPLAVALAFSAACFFPGLVIGSRWVNAPSDSFLVATIILAYTVGASVEGVPAALGLVALCIGSSGGDFSDPIVLVVFTVPAWIAGTAIRSRTELTTQLADRALELDRERDVYAREAVRYERARIARDLHDIVAHNLAMIVVQAGAGRRALSSNPAGAAESLTYIEGGAVQAEREISQLIDLLADHQAASEETGLVAINELVQRAATAGLAVSYAFSGDQDEVAPKQAHAAFHITQEGITNALKHAPGAPISIAVHAAGGRLSVAVENGPARDAPTGLEQTGGTRGLAGLRARVAAAGGELQAGPTQRGGWRLAVEIPTA